MLDYLNAKVADYAVTQSWANQELKNQQSERPEHYRLITRLQEKLNEAQSLHGQLQVITRIGHPMLAARALPIIHDIELWMIIITCYYLPALQKEDNEAVALKNILLLTAERCGLSWIEDILIRLDGVQAIVSVLTEAPVIFTPPQHAVSLLDMTGLYHEFGHNVFRRFPGIADDLAGVVSRYFSDFRQLAGPLGPNERAERDRAINEARRYWNVERLDEIFSDIYATFTCGPAYYFSCVDMALKLTGNPFHVNPIDVHSPPAARVYVCYNALVPIYREEPFVVSIRNVWNSYISTLDRNAEFELVCASALLDCIVGACIPNIATLLPGANRYDEPLPANSDIEQVPPGASLESILNRGGKILLMKPNRYADWEKEALKMLKSQDANPLDT